MWRMKTRTLGLILAALIISMGAAIAYAVGGLDDFEDGTTQGWARGSNIVTGGPAGAGDNYLEFTSTGGGGFNSRWVTFNQIQWSGDFTAAGIGQIQLAARCGACPGPLSLRVAIGDNNAPRLGGTWWVSSTPFSLPNDGNWHTTTFSLAAGAMTQVQGAASHAAVMGNVFTLRILHSAAPSAQGDQIAATVGLDNIASLTPTAVTLTDNNALPQPAPGNPIYLALVLLLLTVFLIRRHHFSATLPQF